MATKKVVGKNRVGRLYGLTALSPINKKTPAGRDRSPEALLRQTLAELPLDHESFFASVPDTYLARFYLLTDVFYESSPANYEHLRSQYLVFSVNFHGRSASAYLKEMWKHAEREVRSIWTHCVAFEKVNGAGDFADYVKRCQIDNALLFNGSTDQPVEEQLKGLYLKQEFGDFAATHQGLPAPQLRQEFLEWADRVKVDDLGSPTWRPGAATLADAVT